MWSVQRANREPEAIEAAIRALFSSLGYSPHGTVFVKPNLCGRAPISEGEQTTVYFMDALLAVLHEQECDVIIGHTSLMGTADRAYPFEKVIADAGFDKYRGAQGTALLDLDDVPRRDVVVGGHVHHVPEVVFEADSYINLAKMKTHMEAGVSLSLKNQMGLMLQAERISAHRRGLDEPIAEFAVACVPTISIVEGIVAMEGNGPHHGEDKYVGVVLAGTDMVELDSAIAVRSGMNPKTVGHISRAAELGAGSIASAMSSSEDDDLAFALAPAQRMLTKGLQLWVFPTTSCSRCITALNEAGKEMARALPDALVFARAALLPRDTSIVIGKPREGDLPRGRVYCIGKCACEGYTGEAARLSVCPPSVSQVRSFLKEHL